MLRSQCEYFEKIKVKLIRLKIASINYVPASFYDYDYHHEIPQTFINKFNMLKIMRRVIK